MTNKDLLIEKIDSSGYKMEYIASVLNLTRAGFRNKVNGESEFKQTEIWKLKCLLKLTMDDTVRIFFSGKVTKN